MFQVWIVRQNFYVIYMEDKYLIDLDTNDKLNFLLKINEFSVSFVGV